MDKLTARKLSALAHENLDEIIRKSKQEAERQYQSYLRTLDLEDENTTYDDIYFALRAQTLPEFAVYISNLFHIYTLHALPEEKRNVYSKVSSQSILMSGEVAGVEQVGKEYEFTIIDTKNKLAVLEETNFISKEYIEALQLKYLELTDNGIFTAIKLH